MTTGTFAPGARVFISYSHLDVSLVDRLCSDLSANNVSVWLDDKDLLPGDSLTRSIEGALANCSAVLLVLSRSSVASAWVQREYRAALSLQAVDERRSPRVIPLIIDDCEVPVFLRDILAVHLRRGYEQAVIQIARSLGIAEAQVPSARLSEDVATLLKQVEIDFHELTAGLRQPMPTYNLLQIWQHHETEIHRLRVLADTDARGTNFDPKGWQLLGFSPDSSGRVPLVTEAYPRNLFLYHVCALLLDTALLSKRFSLDPTVPLSLKELFARVGGSASN